MSRRGPTSRGQEQVENLLAALCLAVNDRVGDAVSSVAAHADTSAAAISALHHFPIELSIDLLSRVLGLTHSGAVRLVDRLEEVGHVRRRPATDRRSITVTLTPAGRRIAGRISDARRSAVRDAMSSLTMEERLQLGRLAGRVLAGMIRPEGATRWMCRMCDTGACGRAEGRCPVALATGQGRDSD